MPERRVAEIVTERNGFGQFFVQPQHLRDGPRDLRHFERVCQTRAVVIASRREEHLRLVLQSPEGLRVNDAVAIALKCRAHIVFDFRMKPSAGGGALGRLLCESLPLACFQLLSKRHDAAISRKKLVPWAIGPTFGSCACQRRPNTSASVCPRSANVFRVPRSTRPTRAPVTSSGTYSRE